MGKLGTALGAIFLALVVLCGGGGLMLMTPLMAGAGDDTTGSGGDCSAVVIGDDPVDGITDEMRRNAEEIIRAGKKEKISEQGWVVAIMVAMQESGLGTAAGIDQPNGDGDAGIFQQRQYPGWYGTLEEVTDPNYAATTFYKGKDITLEGLSPEEKAAAAGPEGYHIPGLEDVDGWEKKSPGEAAQEVQRSAFPDAYDKHETVARALVGDTSGECKDGGGGADIPAGSPEEYEAVYTAMEEHLGLPYSWGGGTLKGPSLGFGRGAGTVGFDCSSYVRYGFHNGAKITLPRTSREQYQATKKKTVAKASDGGKIESKLAPGDVLFWGYSAGSIHHVAMYVGDGKMIEAPSTGKKLRVTKARFQGDFFAATRVLGE